MPTALVSVSDKAGLEELVKELSSKHSYNFIATTSTAKFLSDIGVECKTVKDVTDFPEILGGRVKTLHPRIFAGILSRDTEEDKACLKDLNIDELDMVIVNLYQFEKKLKENLEEPEMIEQIDIGGVALIRAAAKNFSRVAIVSDPSQYDGISSELKSNGSLSKDFRRKLAYEAFSRTMSYDTAISSYLKKNLANCDAGESRTSLPSAVDLRLQQHMTLRYGENPHQSAVWYAQGSNNGEFKFPPFNQLQGKELSSNNIVDTYALVTIMRDLESPAVCIIKHNNPCGVAIGSNLTEALDKAYETDPISAFGGIFGFTEKLEAPLVEKILKGFVEIVAAPSFSEEALALLKKKKNVRVLELAPSLLESNAHEKWHAKDLQDFGWILERAEAPSVTVDKFECVSGEKQSETTMKDVRFAWDVVKHLTSNAIFIAKNGQSQGFGIGQTSRIASVNIALEQAGENAQGAVLASDAFFPATDNIEAAAKAGIKVIVQPGGSIKDKEVIQACKDNNITMLLTGQRCFKH